MTTKNYNAKLKTMFMIALTSVLGAVLFWADWSDHTRAEHIAKQDVSVERPVGKMDQWRSLVTAINQNPNAHSFKISGTSAINPSDASEYYSGKDLSYDRRHKTLRYFYHEHLSYKGEWWESRYAEVTDEILKKFVRDHQPDTYSSSFEEFCRDNGCRILKE